MSAEQYSIFYPQSPFGTEVYVRALHEGDDDARERLRQQAFYNKFVAPGYMTQDQAREYQELLNSPPKPGSYAPSDPESAGVFKREGDTERLVAFQIWGESSYDYPQPSMRHLFDSYAIGGDKDRTPAHIESRSIAEPGKGYGSMLRHAGALRMAYQGYTVVGWKMIEADWPGHVEEIMALQPVLFRRSEKGMGFPVPVENRFAIHRTDLCVGIASLKNYLEGRRAWLRTPKFSSSGK